MPLFLVGAVTGLLSLFGINKAVDNATKPPATTNATTQIPWQIAVPLMVGATVGVVILIKKLAK